MPVRSFIRLIPQWPNMTILDIEYSIIEGLVAHYYITNEVYSLEQVYLGFLGYRQLIYIPHPRILTREDFDRLFIHIMTNMTPEKAFIIIHGADNN